MTHQMLAPATSPIGIDPGAPYEGTVTVNGRLYTATPGAVALAPDQDASPLAANGWIDVALDGAGPTANRPSPAKIAMRYLDTTLAYIVVYDGAFWRNPATGASV